MRTAPADPRRQALGEAALAIALVGRGSGFFAPFLPFVTEEVWLWWQEGSVHRAAWPTPGRAVRSLLVTLPVLRAASVALTRPAQGQVRAEAVDAADRPERRCLRTGG